ncbi:hypothetical protein ATK17_2281 [Branchiibius hedensis]|uniref:Uncharacterized protein n=1 Tax=Branchiibius hedensis TaxID=672460 RepID=A0A2Y8ZXF0_9MICO|nr:hypothetical protein [Branchiibius hedensis]PWJ26137.1 hypothetical protein ATK17_2281 [Branchiibius hedensis]SSA34949.1 hypothetical protein SAMN04489750_2281 [Branchiibius hedensis]
MSAGYRLGTATGIVVRREPDLVVYLANLVSGQITVAPGVAGAVILSALDVDPQQPPDASVLETLVAAGLLIGPTR